ncbi:MAG: hypothetical protein R3A44_21590 [Caldilineaceae bacterium]
MTTLNVLLSDMSRLQQQLGTFEAKFGVKSPEFFAALMRGDLDEFDALDDFRMEFIEWSALYKTWLSLDDKYRQLISRQPIAMQIKANVIPTHA